MFIPRLQMGHEVSSDTVDSYRLRGRKPNPKINCDNQENKSWKRIRDQILCVIWRWVNKGLFNTSRKRLQQMQIRCL